MRSYASLFEKDLYRMDFQMKRILKDKFIIVNLLNKTIEDLKEQQAFIENVNQELSQQKAEIEKKNLELHLQKAVVEEQSEKLSENLEALAMSYKELEQFSYIASHDLKSPLRTIASYAQLLKRRYYKSIDKEADEFIEFIVKGTNQMNEIIRDLLEYSQSGRDKAFDVIDLNDTLEMVQFNLQAEIQESQATIRYSDLPSLFVHKSGMLQLFQNLVGNAIKFRGNDPPLIIIDHAANRNTWQFTVSDNGLGMDESFQEKAFQPFQRIGYLDRPGTGIGLAICRKIVKMHKGDIWYQSQSGKGTAFHFTIAQ